MPAGENAKKGKKGFQETGNQIPNAPTSSKISKPHNCKTPKLTGGLFSSNKFKAEDKWTCQCGKSYQAKATKRFPGEWVPSTVVLSSHWRPESWQLQWQETN